VREIEALATIKHPAVLSVVGWLQTGQDRSAPTVTDWCPNGMLEDALAKERKKRPPDWWNGPTKSMVVVGVTSAMSEMTG
jgi:hypothetical protein